jgi:hypothetical protein
MLPDERESVKAAFQAHPDISTGSHPARDRRGLGRYDLQNHCNYLIHVEIPWNPNVMEQRNGRIDRHGQKEDAVFIWHPVGKASPREPPTDPSNPAMSRAITSI